MPKADFIKKQAAGKNLQPINKTRKKWEIIYVNQIKSELRKNNGTVFDCFNYIKFFGANNQIGIFADAYAADVAQ